MQAPPRRPWTLTWLARLGIVVLSGYLANCHANPGQNTAPPPPAKSTSPPSGESKLYAEPTEATYDPDRKAIAIDIPAGSTFSSGTLTITGDGSLAGLFRVVVWKNDENGSTSDNLRFAQKQYSSKPNETITIDPSKLSDVRKIYVQVYFASTGTSATGALFSHKDVADIPNAPEKFAKVAKFWIWTYSLTPELLGTGDEADIRSSGTFTTPIGVSIRLN